jgi:hypothetical protein
LRGIESDPDVSGSLERKRLSQKKTVKKQRGQEEGTIDLLFSKADVMMLRKQAKKQGLTVSAYVGALIWKYAKGAPQKKG